MLHGIYAKGGEGDVFRFGCFAKADAIPGKTFRIAAAVIYADGTHKWENVDFDPYRSGWQYVSGVVSTDDENSVTNKQYTAVHLYIMYDNHQMNPGYFTDVQFITSHGDRDGGSKCVWGADDFETLTYQMDSVQGKNLYQYCFNNPVNMEDEEGGWPKWVTGINWLATGVTAVCIEISVLTCGVASPVIMAVATTTVVAGTATAVNGAAEIQESVTSKNFVKDKIFKGNEKAYNVYANTTAIVAELGSSVSGAWLVKNKPRIKAYNNIENYKYTKTISDAKHMKRKYNNSVLMQKQIM